MSQSDVVKGDVLHYLQQVCLRLFFKETNVLAHQLSEQLGIGHVVATARLT